MIAKLTHAVLDADDPKEVGDPLAKTGPFTRDVTISFTVGSHSGLSIVSCNGCSKNGFQFAISARSSRRSRTLRIKRKIRKR